MSTLSSVPSTTPKRWTEWILGVIALIAIATPITMAFVNETAREHLSTGDVVGERITSYDSTMDLTATGGASIQETFTYTFRDHTRSGLIRQIPRSLALGGLFRKDRGLTLSSTTRNEVPEVTHVKTTNDALSLGIGAKDQLVTGEQRYHIPYQVQHAVVRTNEADTVRLSPTDTSFGVPIDTASFTVRGPIPPVEASCFIGTSAEHQTADCSTTIEGTTVTFSGIRWIEKGEGLFVSIDYPRGTFTAPLTIDPPFFAPPWLLIILIHVMIALLIWWLVGRDDPGRGVIIPSEELLKEIKPYEAGALIAQRPTYASFMGMILDLARRKAVRLARIEGGGYLMFDVERIEGPSSLDAVEGPVLKRLMMYSTTNDPKEEEAGVASLGRYSEEVRLAYRRFEGMVYDRLVARGWYQADIISVQLFSAIILTGWSYTLLALLESRVNDPRLGWFLWQIPLILPILYFMPRLTKAGALAREQVRGLYRYIDVAEKDRLAFHQNPRQMRDEQEALLPYAVAMGIQSDWVKQLLNGYQKISQETPTDTDSDADEA